MRGRGHWLGALIGAGCSEGGILADLDPPTVPEPPHLELSTHAHPFGEIGFLDPAGIPVTVENTGGSTLRVESVTVDGDPAFEALWNGPLPAQIEPGADYTFQVRAPAEELGAFRATVVLDSNAENAEEGYVDVSVDVRGGLLEVTPSEQDLGLVKPECGAYAFVSVRNVGNAYLGVRTATLTAPDGVSFTDGEVLPFSLDPGDVRYVKLTLLDIAPGPLSASVEVASTDARGSQTAVVLATGDAAGPCDELSPRPPPAEP